MKITNHMNTKIFTWKPSDWGENHRSFTNFRIYFARIKYWQGQQPLYNLLMENKDSFNTVLLSGTNPYKPTE